jgi:hypothetical protein
MSAMKMKENVRNRYGENSFEFGYFQHVFSRRPFEFLQAVYEKMMETA